MLHFSRTTTAVAAVLLAGACAGSAARAPQPENREPAASPTPAAEAKEGVQHASDEHEAQPSDPSAEAEAKNDSGWTPESVQTIVERGRHKLARRCDSGSQAACRALPDLDKCLNLQRRSCASLGDLFARGAAGVSQSPEQARDFWWRACDIESADCLRYGQLLFDLEGLDSSHAVAGRFFQLACTRDFQLCERAGRFYREKQELAQARKFFDLGCSAGEPAACREKK
jgi:hypothetical protein